MKRITLLFYLAVYSGIVCAQNQNKGSQGTNQSVQQPKVQHVKSAQPGNKTTASGNVSGKQNANDNLNPAQPSTSGGSANAKKMPPLKNSSGAKHATDAEARTSKRPVKPAKQYCYWQCPRCHRIFQTERDYCPYDTLTHLVQHCETKTATR